ncbi:MAG: InlB B-repeat-containing protein, partial [Sphingobacteriaceae bacterium]|nr:InlB B-repeat-containing protein [Sphingobacteriaceae bacterium]
MKNMTKTMTIVLCLAALGFASCKNDDVIPTKSSTEDPTTPSTPTTTKMYTVTFNATGGSPVAAVSVAEGKTLAKPTDPIQTGSVFEGWYNESDW